MRVSDLAQNAENVFEITPGSDTMRAIAETLALSGLRKLRFVGSVRAQGASDWLLTGMLGATVTQPCAVTLAPVVTRIDAPVRRVYTAHMADVGDDDEVEMPEDDAVEPLGTWIDPEAVMIEALSLEVPDYPRAPDAALGEVVVTEAGTTPLTQEAARPFAGLADLKAKLEDGEKD